jgi:hypothetical protein
MKVSEMMEVFKAGKEVANPAFWKQHTINLNTLMVAISGLVYILNMFECSICDLQLSHDQLINIGSGVVAIFGAINAGSTMATSTKVGIKPKAKVDQSLADDIGKLQ